MRRIHVTTSETTMGERIINGLANPDEVGESAYGAVHDVVANAVQSAHIGDENDAEIVGLVIDELDNLIHWAATVRDDIAKHA